MKIIILIGFILFGVLSCKKDTQSPNPSPTPYPIDTDTTLMYYYDREENGNLQIFAYDGHQEKNLTNNNNYDYWWVKVHPDRTKFLCY